MQVACTRVGLPSFLLDCALCRKSRSSFLVVALIALVAGCAIAQSETVLYDFGAVPVSRSMESPLSDLVADQLGNLYGTARDGGTGHRGGVFEYRRRVTAGQHRGFVPLYDFSKNDGEQPVSGLILDKAGNFYGATLTGGNGFGTVFELSPQADGSYKETVLYAFASGPDGWYAGSSLMLAPNGNLYGTTFYGGHMGGGTVFQLSPPTTSGGAWQKTQILQFGTKPGTKEYSNGCYPIGKLAPGPKGTIYGVTYGCGVDRQGVAFQLHPPVDGAETWTETVLHSFGFFLDAAYPSAGVVVAQGGHLFGTTTSGGANGAGTVYELVPPTINGGSWTEQILYSFTGFADGLMPYSPVSSGADGSLYGTTRGGGSGQNAGVIYRLNPPASASSPWTEDVVYTFSGGADGANPIGGVTILGGDLFGTTSAGGANGQGALYEIAF